MENQKNNNDSMKKHLLEVPQQPMQKPVPARRSHLLSILGFGFLTFNSGMAIYRSHDDLGAVAFVVASYLDLVLLFVCLELFESTPRGSNKRGYIKFAVWLLSTVLTLMFSYKVAALMPMAVAVVVWAMALSTIFAGFYLFFVYHDDNIEDLKPQKTSEGP
ncbi:hypothetical protein LUZ60_000396 [Juncus effusus]|nr:hypothetical protein LUZ60_000396 [Juncus effusus]